MKNVAVVGAGIVGICTSFFLQKSGHKVTLLDHNEPGSQTSYGHACTFADYASIPVNSPSLFRQIPSMLFKKDSPLAVDFFYVIKHLPWAIKFLNNCRKDKVEEISKSLANFLKHAQLSYDEIFEEVKVSEYIKNEENIYLFDSEKSYNDYKYATLMRKENNVEVLELNKKQIHDLEPNLAPVYYSGQLFVGSRHTTNPLAISKKIFNNFLSMGGKYIKENVKNVLQKENCVEVSLENKQIEFDGLSRTKATGFFSLQPILFFISSTICGLPSPTLYILLQLIPFCFNKLAVPFVAIILKSISISTGFICCSIFKMIDFPEGCA